MSGKVMKKLRKKAKIKLSRKDGYKADHRIAKEKSKMVYFDTFTTMLSGKKVLTGQKVAVKATRKMIVNAAKLPYRRMKKEFKRMLREARK